MSLFFNRYFLRIPIVFSILIFSLFYSSVFAQTKEKSFGIEAGLVQPNLFFTIWDREENESNTYDYEPYNTQVDLLLRFSYENLSVSFRTPLKIKKEDNIIPFSSRKKMNYFDLQFYYFLENSAFDIIYQNYEGFYRESPNFYDNIDIQIKNCNFNYSFLFLNDLPVSSLWARNVSLPTYFTDFYLGIMVSLNYLSLKNDISLVGLENSFTDQDRAYRGGQYYGTAISPILGYFMKLKYFFLHTSLSTGAGIVYKTYTHTSSKDLSLLYQFNFKLNLGLDYGNYFYSLEAFSNSYSDNPTTSFTDIQIMTFHTSFSVGIRF